MSELTLANEPPLIYERLSQNKFKLEYTSDKGLSSFNIDWFKAPQIDDNKIPKEINLTLIDHIQKEEFDDIFHWIKISRNHLIRYKRRYLKNLVVKIFDPAGYLVETWKLENCEVKQSNLLGYTFSHESISTLTLTVQPTKIYLDK